MTSRTLLLAAALLLVAVAPACVSVESTWRKDGVANAAFDLQCSEEQLEMTVLKRNDGLGCLGSKVGVRGCGKQTTYECDDARTWHRSAEISPLDGK